MSYDPLTDLPSLQAAYDGFALSLAHGQPVTLWDDLKNAFDLTPNVDPTRHPEFRFVDGLPFVRFERAKAQYLVSASGPAGTTTGTWFVMVRRRSIADSGGSEGICSRSAFKQLLTMVLTVPRTYNFFNGIGVVGPGEASVGPLRMVEVVFNGASSGIHIEDGGGAYDLTADAGSDLASGFLVVGAEVDGANHSSTDIGAVYYCNAAVALVDRQPMREFLRRRWVPRLSGARGRQAALSRR